MDTVPPARTASMASLMEASMPTASMTESTPSPPVASRIACAEGGANVIAPEAAARSRLASTGSTAKTFAAPRVEGAAQRAHADRAQADHRDRTADRDVGAFGRRPPGRQVVGEQQSLLGGDALRHLQQLEVGGRYREKFCLGAAEKPGTEDLRSLRTADRVVGGAAGAVPAPGDRRHQNPVADGETRDLRPDFDDRADGLTVRRTRVRRSGSGPRGSAGPIRRSTRPRP